MARPADLKTKIFLDSGNPEDTKAALSIMGFLDGQTTNPSLVAQYLESQKHVSADVKLSKEDVYEHYEDIVTEISNIIPNGSVSIEVYADINTTSQDMLKEGTALFTWIHNAHIKFPITHNGLEAARLAVKNGIRVNMTLCFTQEQAAAVYSVTAKNDKIYTLDTFSQIFVSPFIGRLDDRGENGIDLVRNILQMYNTAQSEIQVLGASVRNLNHFLALLQMKCDIITAPLNILKEWVDVGMTIPNEDYHYERSTLKPIAYKDLDVRSNWSTFNIDDPLVQQGIEKFANDWNNLIG